MKEKIVVTTDNIFDDLGLDDSDETLIRSDLMSEVVNIIRKSGLLNKEISTILQISAPKVSSLMNGKINDFSNDTLMNYLTLLGCNIEIRVTPRRKVSKSTKKGKLRVKRPRTRSRRARSKASFSNK